MADTNEDIVPITLRAGSGCEIVADVEDVKRIIMYIANNRGQSARQIAWDMDQPQDLIHATLESVSEAHELVLRGFVAVTTRESRAQWYVDLRDRERKRVPLWNGVFPTYHGPLPDAIRSRPDLHPIFLQGADAIFRTLFTEMGSTPRRAKKAVSERIVGLVARLTQESTVKTFEDLARAYERKLGDFNPQLKLNLEEASERDLDDASIETQRLIGFSETLLPTTEADPVPTDDPIAALESSETEADQPVEALPSAEATQPDEKPGIPPSVRGRNAQGHAASYTSEGRRGRVAIMSYVSADLHARLKAWASFSGESMQSMASKAVEEYIERNGIPQLNEY